MPENPLQLILHSFEKVSNFIQIHLSSLTLQLQPHNQSPTVKQQPISSISHSSKLNPSTRNSSAFQSHDVKGKTAGPVSKEELGRASWTFLHTLAARYPDKPTRQQKKDVKELMSILSRMYPCKECAEHFKLILRENPVQVGSQAEFSQWLCYVHNLVNRSIGKPVFPCERVEARWGKAECENRECDVLGETLVFPGATN
ncbi:FAD-linked sulfhydryl oxidase ERV1 [Morus notabilis]|uniref:FAD-linked sulfhydryl oxidase ERV1 n=1 Tax=Morus notabilis TaxID=981085 RepID=UPI000CED1010|nr:FAD-linked sulfhydryl oxidase ERV1 [Morus notabilis]